MNELTRLKIAMCMEYPYAQNGGVEILFRALAPGLCLRYDVVAMTGDTPDSRPNGLPSAATHLPYRVNDSENAKSISDRILATKPDLIHVHLGGPYQWSTRLFWKSPLWWLGRSGVPLVITNHLGLPLTEGYCGPLKPFWFKLALLPGAWISRFIILDRTLRLLTVSDHDCAMEKRSFSPMANKIQRMYHSVLEPGALDSGQVPRKKIILCVGTIGWRKGQRLLVEAFCKIAECWPDWELHLIGRTAEPDYLKGLETFSGYQPAMPRILFLGGVSDEARIHAMREAAIFAMPSLTEGLGLSLQEALYFKCACIGTRVGGIPDLIRHGETGLLSEPEDANAFANGLKQLMGSEDLRLRFSAAGRAQVEKLGMTMPAMIERHCELYQKLVAQH